MEKWPSGLRHGTANAASVMLRGFKSHLLRMLVFSALLSGCFNSPQEPLPIIFNSTPCNFQKWEEVAALPVLGPGCVIAGVTADLATGYPHQHAYETGGYSTASGGDDGNGFWGGVGPSHLGGGFTMNGPEGTTYVNPPLFP